jgi:hypothetical protein
VAQKEAARVWANGPLNAPVDGLGQTAEHEDEGYRQHPAPELAQIALLLRLIARGDVGAQLHE